MVILAVDYGDARTGIAVSDKTEFLASPVKVIHSNYQPIVIDEVSSICNELKPELIVVGLPKNMDSSIGERAQRCIDFAECLTQKTGIETIMWDERLTTVSAHNYLNQTNTRGKKRKNMVDAVAAVIILQSYLDYRKINK